MTTSTSIAILLALLLGVTLMVAVRHYSNATYLRNKNKDLRAEIKRYLATDNSCNAVYSVRRINNPEHEFNGCWAVCRTSIQDGYLHHTCIKVFTDEDDEFNHSEAQELVDKINE